MGLPQQDGRANAFGNNVTFGASTGLKNFFSRRYQPILY
jgi:hypothetical protein